MGGRAGFSHPGNKYRVLKYRNFVMNMIKHNKKESTTKTGCIRIPPSALWVKTFCVFLVLVSLVMSPGCTTAPSVPGDATTVTTSHSTTVSPLPSVSSPASDTGQSAANIQLKGNVYGISTNPQVGIEIITFTIGLAQQAPADIDLSRLEIAFSAPGTDTVILKRGTRDSTSMFTATMGNNEVTSMHPGNEVEIVFRVKGVPAGSRVNIELKPSSGAALPISRTVPAMLLSVNNHG
jgi:archaellin